MRRVDLRICGFAVLRCAALRRAVVRREAVRREAVRRRELAVLCFGCGQNAVYTGSLAKMPVDNYIIHKGK